MLLACRVSAGLLGAAVVGLIPKTASSAEQTVEFQAERVEVDQEGDAMVLEGDVSVSSGRYRLTGDRVAVRRTPRGVLVDGQGRVALCPCPDPPVSLGFQSALIAPPTDLLLTQPTLRAGSVPVVWLPYLWLRSPARWGALPPKVAWRADDGLLAGTGVHAPLGSDGTAADVRAAGYLEGGVELEGRLNAPRSTTTIRWDHLRESLLVGDSRGYTPAGEGSTVAWDLDAIRGPRAARGPLLLESVARRYDRVRVGASWASSNVALGISSSADAERGGDLNDVGAVGPGLHLSLGAPIDEIGTSHLALSTQTLTNEESGVASMVGQTAHIDVTVRPGVISTALAAHTAAAALVEEGTSEGGAATGLVGTLAMPFVRDYGDDVLHVVSPFAEAGGKIARADTSAMPWLHGDGGRLHAALGLRTTVGSYASRRGAAAVMRAGAVGTPDALTRLVSAKAVAELDTFALSGDAAWRPESGEDAIVIGSARLGRADGLHLSSRAVGRPGAALEEARTLTGGGWESIPGGWLDRRGWAFGGSIGVPWASWLASGIDADYDWTHRELLGVRGATAYHHPCQCLAVMAWAGHRTGRDGIDAMLTFDLAP